MSKPTQKQKDNAQRRFDNALVEISKMPVVKTVNGRLDFSEGTHVRVDVGATRDGRPLKVWSEAHQDER